MLEWVLVMILIDPTNGLNHFQVLNTYDTAEECHKEAVRVGDEMKKAYPNDTSFQIVCKDPDTSLTPDPTTPPVKTAI